MLKGAEAQARCPIKVRRSTKDLELGGTFEWVDAVVASKCRSGEDLFMKMGSRFATLKTSGPHGNERAKREKVSHRPPKCCEEKDTSEAQENHVSGCVGSATISTPPQIR
jgi:hypothetical protein